MTEIFQALSVSVWLLDEGSGKKLRFAASTFLSEAKGNAVMLESAEVLEILTALRNHPEPVDIDTSRENWAVALRKCHPDEFRKGGDRICVPLLVSGDVVGLLILGDRVGGARRFPSRIFDLLRCVADPDRCQFTEGAALPRNYSRRRSWKAFQTMSAFFVHDLKNTASTLNLMLQNLPVHFDDPAFREDALRGVAKTVNHINRLISRLGMIRHEPADQGAWRPT